MRNGKTVWVHIVALILVCYGIATPYLIFIPLGLALEVICWVGWLRMKNQKKRMNNTVTAPFGLFGWLTVVVVLFIVICVQPKVIQAVSPDGTVIAGIERSNWWAELVLPYLGHTNLLRPYVVDNTLGNRFLILLTLKEPTGGLSAEGEDPLELRWSADGKTLYYKFRYCDFGEPCVEVTEVYQLQRNTLSLIYKGQM